MQYSAFFGHLKRNELNSLTVELKKLIGDATENVQIYPICDLCFRGRREVGKPKKYELDERRPKFVYF